MHSHASASISNSQLSGASCGIVFGTAKYSTTISAAYPSGTRSFPARQRSALVMRPSAQTRYSAEKSGGISYAVLPMASGGAYSRTMRRICASVFCAVSKKAVIFFSMSSSCSTSPPALCSSRSI